MAISVWPSINLHLLAKDYIFMIFSSIAPLLPRSILKFCSDIGPHYLYLLLFPLANIRTNHSANLCNAN